MTVIRTRRELGPLVLEAGGESITLMIQRPTYQQMLDAHLNPEASAERVEQFMRSIGNWEDVTDESGAPISFQRDILKSHFADHPGLFRAFHSRMEAMVFRSESEEPAGELINAIRALCRGGESDNVTAQLFFRLGSLGRLSRFLGMSTKDLLDWDGGTVTGLLEAFHAYEDAHHGDDDNAQG